MPRFVCKTFVHVKDPHPQSPAMLAALNRWYRYELCAEPRWVGKLNWRNDILLALYKSDVSLTCAYCGKTNLQPYGKQASSHALTFDHIIPRAEGGTDHEDNLALACHPCNNRKAATILTDDVFENVVTIFQLLYANVKTKKELSREAFEVGRQRSEARKIRKAAEQKIKQQQRQELKTNHWNLWGILCGD